MYDPNKMHREALKKALDKLDVLSTRREKLLLDMVIREIERFLIFPHDQKREMICYNGKEILRFYLMKGYATFQDLGISPKSTFNFFLTGWISREMYIELKASILRLDHTLYEGGDRKEEYQHSEYIDMIHAAMK